jgi:hypothetical protein
MRRIPAVVAIVIGATMIIGLVAMSGFSKASDGEDLIRDAGPTTSNTGVVRLRKDVTILNQASDDVVTKVFPAFAQQLGIDDTEFARRLRATHPAAEKAFLDQRTTIFASVDKTASNLEAHQDDYDAADAIPTSWLPLTIMPWLAMGFALALVAVGVWAWRRPGRASMAALAGVGVLLIAFTLGTELPRKSHQTERLLDSLRIDEQVATRTRAEFDTFKAGTDDLRQVFVELAAASGQTPAELGRAIRQQLPAVAQVAQDSSILDRLAGEVSFREDHIDEFAAVKDVPLELVSWSYVVFGGVLVVAGGVGLLLAEDRRPAEPAQVAGGAAPV